MKINWHIRFIVIALGIGLLWVYSSQHAKLILEFDQPVRLQIADHDPYKSSRFVTTIPVTSTDSFTPLALSLETPGSHLRTIAIANRGQQFLHSPNASVQTGIWKWDIANHQWQSLPPVSAPSTSPDVSITLVLENPPPSLLPKTMEDFLFSTTLAFLALEAARFLLLALNARFRRLVFH